MTPPWKKHEAQHFYDNIRAFAGAIGTVEARAWRRRYFDAVAQKAVSQNARRVAQQPAPAVPSGEHLPGEGVTHAAEETEPAVPAGFSQKPTVEVTTFDSGTMSFRAVDMVASKDLLRQLRAEARIYERVLECRSFQRLSRF
jgi:hypothetical protein